jgi:hypothetical protein
MYREIYIQTYIDLGCCSSPTNHMHVGSVKQDSGRKGSLIEFDPSLVAEILTTSRPDIKARCNSDRGVAKLLFGFKGLGPSCVQPQGGLNLRKPRIVQEILESIFGPSTARTPYEHSQKEIMRSWRLRKTKTDPALIPKPSVATLEAAFLKIELR